MYWYTNQTVFLTPVCYKPTVTELFCTKKDKSLICLPERPVDGVTISGIKGPDLIFGINGNYYSKIRRCVTFGSDVVAVEKYL